MLFVFWIILVIIGLVPAKLSNLQITDNCEISFDTIYSIIVVLFFTLITYLGTKAPDYRLYKLAFDGVNSGAQFTQSGSGLIFDLVNRLCGTYFHMNFRVFKTAVIFFVFLIYFIFAHKFTKCLRYFFALLLMYPGLLLVVQFRYAFATSLFLLSILFRIKSGKFNYLISLIFLLLASQIHSSMYFFVIIVFVDFVWKHWKFIWIHRLEIVIFLALTLVILKGPLIKLMSMFVSTLRAQRYLVNVETGKAGLVIYILSFIVNYLISVGLLYRLFEFTNLKIEQKNLIKYENILRLLTFFSIVLVMQTPDFLRISRTVYLLSFVTFSIFEEQNFKYITVPLSKYYEFDLNVSLFYPVYIFATGFIYIFCFTPKIVISLLGA